MTHTASTYFFKEEPKQFFVGAELCARWYLVLKGRSAPPSVERVIAYCQDAQGAFSWILAGERLSTLAGRFKRKEWDAESISLFFDALGYTASCGDIVANKLFELKVPHFIIVGFAVDTLVGLADAKSSTTDSSSTSYLIKVLVIAKSVNSLFITFISMGVYFGAQHYTLPYVSLVLESTVLVMKVAHYSLKI